VGLQKVAKEGGADGAGRDDDTLLQQQFSMGFSLMRENEGYRMMKTHKGDDSLGVGVVNGVVCAPMQTSVSY
jgi:hypothetical protein